MGVDRDFSPPGCFILLGINNVRWRTQETYCRYWLSLNANNMTFFYGLGKSLLEKGDYDSDIRYFEKGLQVARYNSACIPADVGCAYFLKGDNPKAEGYYQIALRTELDYSVTDYYRGLLYLNENQFEQASRDFSAAMRLYSENPGYKEYFNLARRNLD